MFLSESANIQVISGSGSIDGFISWQWSFHFDFFVSTIWIIKTMVKFFSYVHKLFEYG